MPARATPQRNLANGHVMRVSWSDSYALLFLLSMPREFGLRRHEVHGELENG